MHLLKFYQKDRARRVNRRPVYSVLPGVMLVFCHLIITPVFSQSTVTGKVTDAADGSALPGVNVVIKGTTLGTQTDAEGGYQLAGVPSEGTLVFSFIGKQTRETAVANRTTVDISLEDDVSLLTEVVVVGYGTQKKSDLTGSVTAINSADFVKGNIVSPEQLVAGKIAGVQIASDGGQPGSSARIRIRGGSSLSASNDPLLVIDGMPIDNSSLAGASNPLSFINPNDIETFTVLKDASATAIYGSRASNGVIIITTKKGWSGDGIRVNFSTLFSSSQKTGTVDVLTAGEFRKVVEEQGSAAQKALMGTANTDWQELIYRNALSTDNNLSVTGAVKGMPFRVSVGYLKQNGILKTSDMGRTSASLGLSPQLLNKHLKVDLNLKGTIIKNRFADQGAIGAAAFFDPTQPVYGEGNRYGGYFEWLTDGKPNTLATRNPLALLEMKDDRSTVNRSIGNIQFDYTFHGFKDLRANLNLGYDVSSSDGRRIVPVEAASNFFRNGQYFAYDQQKTNKTLEFYLNYVKNLEAIDSKIDVMAGYSWQDFLRSGKDVDQPFAKDTVLSNVPYKTQSTLVSFYGRVNYALKDRYLVTATLRRDGSSRFSPENRWGLFPSVALAWKLKEENFLKGSKALTDLKLRLGYGITGQQDIGGTENIGNNYPYLARYTLSLNTAMYRFGNDFVYTLRPEPYDANIRWEQTATLNAGLDYAFADGRIYGSVDVYSRKTKDLLNTIPTAAGSSLSNSLLTNVGSLENKGVEVTLNISPFRKEDWNLDLGFNLTANRNKITRLTNVSDPSYLGVATGSITGGTGNNVQIHSVEYPVSAFYLYRQVYNTAGMPVEGLYVDRNESQSVTPEDKYHIKSPAPSLFLGFSPQFTWRKLAAGFVMRANIGNYVYNNVSSAVGAYGNINNPNNNLSNVHSSVLRTQFALNQYFSDYYLENASFLRMDNFNVSYQVGKILGDKVDLRISGNVQNVFVITKYSGLDPEIPSGIDNNFYPRPRIYALGLNLGF